MKSAKPSTPIEILNEALRREHSAFSFYDRLAARCHVMYVKELLEQLKNEEFKHARLIEDRIAKLHMGKDVLNLEP